MKTDGVKELLSKADVAKIVGVTPGAILLAAQLGKIRVAAQTPGGWRLFERADVEAFLRDRKAAR